jgi:MFS family permease
MSLIRYRRVLRLPGVTRLLAFALVARVPLVASGIVLTLHVVLTMHLGYAAAGLVGTAMTLGAALGAPALGRAVDTFGLRKALIPSVITEAVVWSVAPFVGYRALLFVAVVGGVLGLPLFTVVRQSLSVLVPPDGRRTAYAMDSIGVEISFMAGPAIGVAVATGISTQAALIGVGVLTVASGVGLLLLNPPTRGPDAALETSAAIAAPGATARRRRFGWVSASLLAVFAATAAAAMVLAGTDVGVVALLRDHGAVTLTGLVFVSWGVASIIGGLLYGAARRPMPPFVLLLGLAVLTIPIGLAPGPAWLMIAILPAGALCAPVLSATAEAVSHLVPERVRGEAMGWHGSSLTLGLAAGAPIAGAAIDRWGPGAGFAVVGGCGAVVAVVGLALVARSRHRVADVAARAGRAPYQEQAARTDAYVA